MRPTLFLPPTGRAESVHSFGSEQTDYYRAIAVDKKATATSDYNDVNPIFSSDVTRYNADTDEWNRVKVNMSQTDFDNCYNALQSAYYALDSENNQVTSAYEHLGVAQQLLADGDNAGNDMLKIQKYQQSAQSSDAAVNCCQAAGPPHTQFSGFMDTAAAILANYG